MTDKLDNAIENISEEDYQYYPKFEDLDIIQLYFNDITKISDLTPEEEVMDPTENLTIRNRYIETNLRLVIYFARRFHKNYTSIPLLEFIQTGNLGLIEAIDKFKSSYGTKFSTYAAFWIKRYMHVTVRDYFKSMHIPENIYALNRRIKEYTNDYVIAFGKEPSVELIAANVGATIEQVGVCVNSLRPAESLESGIITADSDNKDLTICDTIADDTFEKPEDALIKNEASEILQGVLETLTDKEKEILCYRFGLSDDKPRTLDEVSKILGCSQEYVRQIETKALRKLRNPVRARGLRTALGLYN